MDNRSTLLSARFSSVNLQDVTFLDLDLREATARPLLGRRGRLQVGVKLLFKAEDDYRREQSVFELWADVRVSGQSGVPMLDVGRAAIADPVVFGAGQPSMTFHDPWTREVDCLALDLDYRQLDEIEQGREGGPLTFTFTIGGLVHHGGRIAVLYPRNHQLTYEISASTWTQLLNQLGYGAYLTVEIPLAQAGAEPLTGAVQKATDALQEALVAYGRGDYDEAVADCRPGFDALRDADRGRFTENWLSQQAGWDERFSWVGRSTLSITHLAHHPNDTASSDDAAPAASGRPNRIDADAVIAMLATLIRWRQRRG